MNVRHLVRPLFAWDSLEDHPSLRTVRQLLAAFPDAKLLEPLHVARGKWRNDYPVAVHWETLLVKILLRHVNMEACLAELHRNESLRATIGIRSAEAVPKAWNMSRFEETLGEEPHRTLAKGSSTR